MFPVHQYTVCSFRPEHKPPEGNPSQLPMPVPAAASGESLCSRSPQLQPPGTEKGQALTTRRWQLTAPPAPTLGQMLPWRKNWSPPARHTQQFSVSSAVAYPEQGRSWLPWYQPAHLGLGHLLLLVGRGGARLIRGSLYTGQARARRNRVPPPGLGICAMQAQGAGRVQKWYVQGWPANDTTSSLPLHSCHTSVLSLSLAQLVAQETHTLNVPGVT